MHFRQDHPSFSNSIFRKNFSTKIVPLHTYNVILTTPDVKEQATVRETFFGDPQLFFPKTFWTIRLHLWLHRLETLRAISKETYRFLPLPKNTAHVLRDFDNNDRCFCTQSSEEPHFFFKKFTFTKPWECVFDHKTNLADNFWTKSREIDQKFNRSTPENLLHTREKRFCHHQLKSLSSQIDRFNRN